MDLEKKLTPSILIAFAVETLSATWFLKIPGWGPLFSILYLVSGIAIAGMLLYFPGIRPFSRPQTMAISDQPAPPRDYRADRAGPLLLVPVLVR